MKRTDFVDSDFHLDYPKPKRAKYINDAGARLSCLVAATTTLVPTGPRGSRIFTFGGFHFYSGDPFNDLHILELAGDAMRWTEFLYHKGPPPSSRNDHSMTLWGKDKLVVFGGCDKDEQYCNDLHILDLSTMTWTSPETRGLPPLGRARHAACIHNDKLYIHGGQMHPTIPGSDSSVLDDLNILDLRTMTWHPHLRIPGSARYLHVGAVYDGRLYLYGGWNAEMARPASLVCVEVEERVHWEMRVDGAEKPPLLGQHFAQIYGSLLVVLVTHSLKHGDIQQNEPTGVWTLDLRTLRWKSRGGGEYFARCHWHYFASCPNSTRCYLLGTDDRESDEYFSAVLEVDFESMGVYDTPRGELGKDLADIFDKAEGSDLEIISATPDAPSIRCHRSILQARWKYFSNLMGSGCKESLTPSTLRLPDDYHTLRALLYYLYTDTLPSSQPVEIVCSLLPLANMYCIPRLQRLCATELDKAINVESVARIFEVAGRAGEQGLKEKALGVMWGKYGEVISTEGFRNLPKKAMHEFLDSTPKESVVLVQPRRWIRGRAVTRDGRGREPHSRGRLPAATAEAEGEAVSDNGGSEGEEGDDAEEMDE